MLKRKLTGAFGTLLIALVLCAVLAAPGGAAKAYSVSCTPTTTTVTWAGGTGSVTVVWSGGGVVAHEDFNAPKGPGSTQFPTPSGATLAQALYHGQSSNKTTTRHDLCD